MSREPGWPQVAETPPESDDVAEQGRSLALRIAAEGIAQATGIASTAGSTDVVMQVKSRFNLNRMLGQLVVCDHLAPPTSGPAFWVHSAPTRLLCRLCLPEIDVPERCDTCSAEEPLRLRRWVLTIDIVSVVAYFCADCNGSLPEGWRAR